MFSMKIKNTIFSILFVLTFFHHPGLGQDIVKYIQDKNIDSVKHFVQQGYNINGIYPRYTMLELAIRTNNKDLVEWLIDNNANVNQPNNKYTPLITGVIYGQHYNSNEIVEILVNNNANIDFKGFMGLTSFVLACKLGNSQAAILLFEKGADYTIRDQIGNDFFYYVIRGKDHDLIEYFISKGFKIPRISSFRDGPYLKWRNDKLLELNYLQYDSLEDLALWTSEQVNMDQKLSQPFLNEIYPRGPKYKNIQYEKWEYKNVDEIFVLSDIHGHYEHFVNLLLSNSIIDGNLNWSWGKGHLVICGDVFDRGHQVTECLWLIYKLENQAETAGGKVHYIMGNHELMILKDNDKSYVNDKYILPYAKAGVDYHDLFGHDTELGRWIRTKNVAVKINNILFVHGGIPPEFVDIGNTIENMNQLMHTYLSENPDSVIYVNNLTIQPTWYRGYFGITDLSKELKKIRNYYQVKHIVVGHTPVSEIKPIQDGSVIAVGVHFGEPGVIAEGLLINNKNFYCVDENGKKRALEPVSGL